MQLTLIKLVRHAFGRDRHADVDWHQHLALVRKQDISTGERIERPHVMRRKSNGRWQYRAETIGEREEVRAAGVRSAPDDRKPTYFSRIDTLRAVAVLAVIHIHYFAPLMPLSIMFLPNGVQLFFVISGFLITRSLLEESRHKSLRTTLLNFYIRRIFRIMPAYYALVATGLLLGLYGFRQSWPWIVSYTLNIYAVLGGDGGYAGHLWSLAVEEQFYLVVPFIVLLLPRTAVVVLLAGLIVGAIIYRLFSFGVTTTFAFNTLANMDHLSIGVLAALAVREFGAVRVERPLRWAMITTVPAFLVCSCAPLLGPRTLHLAYGIPISLCSVFFAWLLVRAVRDGPASSSWGGLVLPKIGAMSYGIYLIHYTLLAAVYPLEAGSPSIALRCMALAATLVMAWLSFRFFEGPMMKLGRRMTV